MNEPDLMDYHDTIVDFAFLVHKHGLRRVLVDLQAHYPDIFNDIKHNIAKFPEKPLAALFRKKDVDSV